MLAAVRDWQNRHPGAGDLLLLGVLGLILFGTGLGLRHPWPADEPRFALIARDMVATGEWFFPRVGGELYADKPPLFFWFMAALHWLIGPLRHAFLLPSLAAALGVVALVYDLGTRLWDRRSGFAAALLLMLTVQFAEEARFARIDMFLTFWTTLGVYALSRHLIDGPRWGWYAIGGVAMGLGVISKGVGFLPWLMLLPWAWAAVRRWPGATRAADWRWALAPAAMLAAIALWIGPMLWLVAASADPAFAAYRDEILLKQTAERYASAWHHVKPFWYFYVNVIPPLWLPLSLLLPWLLPRWWRALRARDLRVLLLLGWVLSVLLFFTFSPGKRGVYLLPALPAVALAAGPWLDALLRRRGVNIAACVVLATLGGLLAAGFVYLAWIDPERAARLAGDYEVPVLPSVAMVTALVAAWLAVMRVERGFVGLAGLLASLWLFYGLWGYPRIDAVFSGRDLVAATRAQWPPGRELGLISWREQFLLYIDRPVTVFGRRRFDPEQELFDAVDWLTAEPARLLLVPGWAREQCFPGGGTAVEFSAHLQWYLVDATGADAGCAGRGDPHAAHDYRPPVRPGR